MGDFSRIEAHKRATALIKIPSIISEDVAEETLAEKLV